jgi:DNA-binding CsgD family transcriptional regulator
VDASESEWLNNLASRVEVSFGSRNGVAAYCVALGPCPQPRSYVEVGAVPAFHRDVVALGHPNIPNPAQLNRMYRALGTSMASELLAKEPDNWSFVQGMFRHGGFDDCAALLAYDGMGETATFTSYVSSPFTHTRRTRVAWRRIATHIASGLRLRRRLARIEPAARLDHAEAVLESDGRVSHAAGPAASRPAREALRLAVRAADRARAGSGRDDPESGLLLWRGLVRGRWSLLDHFDADGRRFVVALRNDPGPHIWLTLSAVEQQVVEYASLGLSNKEIAYALGRAPSTIASHLGSGLRKLGGLSRNGLCSIAGDLSSRTPRRSVVVDDDIRVDAVSSHAEDEPLAYLTPAERQVALDAIQGLSNQEIATRRERAERTVANQLASVYVKTGARSRVELAALHAGRGRKSKP